MGSKNSDTESYKRVTVGMLPKKKKKLKKKSFETSVNPRSVADDEDDDTDIPRIKSKKSSKQSSVDSEGGKLGGTVSLLSALTQMRNVNRTSEVELDTKDDSTSKQDQSSQSSNKLHAKLAPQQDDPPRVQAAPVRMSDAEKHSKILELMRSGAGYSDQQLAVKFDMDLASVLRMRKEFVKTAKMSDPRALFAKRLSDIDEAFDASRERFFDDPGNEAYIKAMNDFARTLRELVQSYNELEDPKEIASTLVLRVMRPFLMGMLKPVVEALDNMQVEMSAFLPEHTRAMIETSVLGSVRKMQANTSIEFNKAVSTISSIYQVDLTELRITDSSKLAVAGGTKQNDGDAP